MPGCDDRLRVEAVLGLSIVPRHWPSVRNGTIDNYQMIVPITWTARRAPRKGDRGAWG